MVHAAPRYVVSRGVAHEVKISTPFATQETSTPNVELTCGDSHDEL
jgi:hypothetical protein